MSIGRLAFDSSPLNYIARASQLPFLQKLVADMDCVITRAVEDELLRGASKHAQLYQVSSQEWIRVVEDSSIEFLQLFFEYQSRLGGGSRNTGEAATLAYAELHSLTACIDDRAARRHGQERGVPLTGTLELVCRGIRAISLTRPKLRGLLIFSATTRHSCRATVLPSSTGLGPKDCSPDKDTALIQDAIL